MTIKKNEKRCKIRDEDISWGRRQCTGRRVEGAINRLKKRKASGKNKIRP